jgi:hypothetical protein
MGKFVLQKSPYNFLKLRLGPWGKSIPLSPLFSSHWRLIFFPAVSFFPSSHWQYHPNPYPLPSLSLLHRPKQAAPGSAGSSAPGVPAASGDGAARAGARRAQLRARAAAHRRGRAALRGSTRASARRGLCGERRRVRRGGWRVGGVRAAGAGSGGQARSRARGSRQGGVWSRSDGGSAQEQARRAGGRGERGSRQWRAQARSRCARAAHWRGVRGSGAACGCVQRGLTVVQARSSRLEARCVGERLGSAWSRCDAAAGTGAVRLERQQEQEQEHANADAGAARVSRAGGRS